MARAHREALRLSGGRPYARRDAGYRMIALPIAIGTRARVVDPSSIHHGQEGRVSALLREPGRVGLRLDGDDNPTAFLASQLALAVSPSELADVIERAVRCAEGADADAPIAVVYALLDALGVEWGTGRTQCPECGSVELGRVYGDPPALIECTQCDWSWEVGSDG